MVLKHSRVGIGGSGFEGVVGVAMVLRLVGGRRRVGRWMVGWGMAEMRKGRVVRMRMRVEGKGIGRGYRIVKEVRRGESWDRKIGIVMELATIGGFIVSRLVLFCRTAIF